jgi:ParB/RepB/Spo0J family partition protein
MRSTEVERTYFTHLPTSRIRTNPDNPRKAFDPTGIEELATSIGEHGLLQPIIVFKRRNTFVLICGERRLRAARKAALKSIPAIVHPVPPEDQKILSMMLVENLQRKEVDMVSESTAIRRLIEEHEWTIAMVSRSLGAGAAFVRNRFLLTRFSDVLQAFTEEKITFSQAIELASVENDDVRKWFFLRMESGELTDQKALSAAVARDREIRAILSDPLTLERPLRREHIEFEVKGLPYCDPSCPHYCRFSWDEKQEYKIQDGRPGWAEFCSDRAGKCYAEKAKAKKAKLAELSEVKIKRPILDQDFSSMFWLMLDGLSCQKCKWMVKAVDLEETGARIPETVHAFCTCPNDRCYEKRLQQIDRQKARDQTATDLLDGVRHDHLREQLEKASNSNTGPSNKAQMTKRECVFLLLQLLTLLGGEKRLRDFSGRNGWAKLLPAQRNAKVGFLRNKLMRDFSERELHETLLDEACLSAGYSEEPFPSLRFERAGQREIAVIIGAKA